MTQRRRFLQGLAAGTLGSSGIWSQAAQATVGNSGASNLVTVGNSGADFTDIQAAIDSIADAGPENPYLVAVHPGRYGAFAMSPWVSVAGSGRHATVIEVDSTRRVDVAAFCTLQSMLVRYRGNGGGDEVAAISRRSEVTDSVIQDLEIDVGEVSGAAGPRWAIAFFSGSHDLTLYDVKIRTESCGISVTTGNFRLHGVDCYLAPGSTGVPHIGLRVEAAARFDWFGGRLGTGYYYDQDLNDPGQDVIGALVPEDNTQSNLRVQLRDMDIYARAASFTGIERVNAVRAENGWFRLFNTRCQTEAGTDSPTDIFTNLGTPSQPAEGWGGKVEMAASRGGQGPGNCFGGGGELGVTGPLTESTTLDQDQSGLILVDASLQDVTVELTWNRSNTGRQYVIRRVDTSANAVVVQSNRSIDGRDAYLLRPGATLRSAVTLVSGRDQWHTI